MSEIVSHDVRNLLTIPKQQRKTPLTRTKPVDSFTDLCQQLTNVVAHQTALSEKLIEAFRETKEINQNNLQIPLMENSRISPVPETNEYLTRQTSMVSSGSMEEEDYNTQGGKTVGMEGLNCVASNIDTMRSCNYAAMNQIRAILTGQVHQENLQSSLSQVYSMMSLINTQCGVCKTGLLDFERKSVDHKLNYVSNATNQCKSTQTESPEVDTGESDADDKDSGLESNSGRISETGVSLEDFQLYTDYDELMQAPVPEENSEEMKRRPSFLKDKKNSCPTSVLERKIKIKNPIDRVKQSSLEETREETESSSEIGELSGTNDTLKLTNSFDVFPSPSEGIETLSVQSLTVQNEGEHNDQVSFRSPKLHRLQRAKTICNPTSRTHGGFSEDEDSLNFNITQSSMENEKETESDFANLESQVNIIKFNYSTNSFTSKGRRDSLQSLVFGTRKQISSEINDLLNKLTSNKRRKITTEEILVVEEMTRSLFDRIDRLMQLSQQFGAILHETTHSDEKEILINFIEMVKTLHRPTSIPISGAISFTYQRTDSVVSSGENDRRPASPTPGRYTFKAMETNYEKGVNEGIDYMKCTFQTEMNTKNEKLDKFLRVSQNIDSVLNSEMDSKNNFILGSGAYIAFILFISVIFMFFFKV